MNLCVFLEKIEVTFIKFYRKERNENDMVQELAIKKVYKEFKKSIKKSNKNLRRILEEC